MTESKKLWSTDYGPDVPTPTSDGERLYIIDDRGISLNLRVSDGSTIWDRTRIEPGTYSASPLLADGKIYAISEEGTTTVLKAGDEFEILAVNRLDDYTLASPAVAGESDLHPHGRVPVLHRQAVSPPRIAAAANLRKACRAIGLRAGFQSPALAGRGFLEQPEQSRPSAASEIRPTGLPA